MKIGVTGYKGRLGSVLVKQFGCTPIECDIANFYEARRKIAESEVDVLINCAAFANPIDICETDPKKAFRVNVNGPSILREVFDGHLIHISSSYVFDGKKGNYTEKSKPNPVNMYGFTKWGGELMLQTYENKKTSIVRTIGLYGSPGYSDFVSMVLGALNNSEEIEIADDICFNPTYIPHLCNSLIYLCEFRKDSASIPTILNISGESKAVSRFTFANQIAMEFGLQQEGVDFLIPVHGVKTWVAERPKNSGLSNSLANSLGLGLPSVSSGLKDYKQAIE